MIDRYGVRPTDPELPVMSLSGGNQQKVVLGRAIEMATSVLVLEEPTAGVDVGAKADIYALMSKTAAEGLAIVLVSSDFEEVARISDRVMVLDRGRIVRQLVGDDAGIDEITRSATGGDFAMFTA